MKDQGISQRDDKHQPMSPLLRFHEIHGGADPVLPVISRDYFRGMEAKGLSQLAQKVGLPVAAVRGVGTFYSDLDSTVGSESQVQVCYGTSCCLAGSSEKAAALRRYGHSGRPVYCLGYCDRSPVSTDEIDHVDGVERPDIRNSASAAVVTKRIGQGSFSHLEQAREAGVYASLEKALSESPQELLDLVENSGERGRGGAGFSTGRKWKSAAQVPSEKRYVIANGDEGDPGSFIDRVLMEDDPHSIIEGMILCGYAIGADEGIIYVRSEYPRAFQLVREAVEEAQKAGYLGSKILGFDFNFDVRVFEGKGSYVCGEETALLNSLEGLRGEVRIRPPYPTESGLYGKPTVVNNVETLVNIPFIVREGADAYARLGTESTNGTKALCLNWGFARPGIVEVEFGITFREVIEELAGGAKEGTSLAAVLVGGPMGTLLLEKDWDVPICYRELSARNIQLGHGGLVAVAQDADFQELLQNLIEFMVRESCGKCAPCRLGSFALQRAVESGGTAEEILEILETIETASLCGFGQGMPGPIRSIIRDFPEKIFGETATA